MNDQKWHCELTNIEKEFDALKIELDKFKPVDFTVDPINWNLE